ncbi:hypothetical protein LCGC14_2450610 [marine sediment metagenome]|uniref:Uncharacterized protein n=1 Tax=marine sediment metagenome TaxID=412755 RepID=A0A0F9BGN7_9ZZZZ
MAVTQQKIEAYLDAFRGREVHINTIMKDLELAPEEAQILRVLLCGRLRAKKLTKPTGSRDGWFKVLLDIKPIKVAGVKAEAVYDFTWPQSHSDSSAFGFEDLITISQGDLIIIAGRSNAGKSAIAHNILGENIDKHSCLLMGNEIASSDGLIMPKFLRRLKRMRWANFFNGDGELNFTLLPIRQDYEDYLEKNALNIVDWISIPEKVWMIGSTLDDIKKATGNGISVAVLQKKNDSDYGYGGEPTEHYADVYIKIDPYGETESRLTLGKVKEKKKRCTGRMWAFKIIDFGANLSDIREIEKCKVCWGKGWKNGYPCDNCKKTGYIDVRWL